MSVVNDYEPMEHLSVEVMRFKDSIMTFKQMEGLLEYFYGILNPGHRGLIDRLIPGGLERYSYETAAKFLDHVDKTNKNIEKDQLLIILLGQLGNLTQKVEEQEELLIHRRNRHQATSQSSPTRVPSAATPIEIDVVLAQTPLVTPALSIAPPPRLLNKLKGEGVRTILEEKLLSTEGLEGKYPGVHYHEFEQFTKPRGPYIRSWVWEFYTTYGELVPKEKKKAGEFRPVKSILVRGKVGGTMSSPKALDESVKVLLFPLCLYPLNPYCTETFGGQPLARRKYSVTRQKDWKVCLQLIDIVLFVENILTLRRSFANMARPKVAGRIMPPRQIRAKNFRKDTNEVNPPKMGSEGKHPSSSKISVPRDPNVPSWTRAFYTALHSFLAAHDLDNFRNSVAVEPSKVAPGTIIQVQDDTSGTNAKTDLRTNCF
uniref:Integrase core domain containing protein n=1 Tax=Solanum tuberosum TaxID=4113 RepID=M1DEK4_SOLTU